MMRFCSEQPASMILAGNPDRVARRTCVEVSCSLRADALIQKKLPTGLQKEFDRTGHSVWR